MKTVKVKIAVVVNCAGEWTSGGWSNGKDEDRKEAALCATDGFSLSTEDGRDTLHWIEAEVPIPASPEESVIHGTSYLAENSGCQLCMDGYILTEQGTHEFYSDGGKSCTVYPCGNKIPAAEGRELE